MNVEIGAEAALFPEKDYIKGISLLCKALSVWLGLEVAHCCGFHGFQTFGSCPGVSPTGRQAEVRNVQICINPTDQATQLIHSYLN
jgi:hypothetical protein